MLKHLIWRQTARRRLRENRQSRASYGFFVPMASLRHGLFRQTLVRDSQAAIANDQVMLLHVVIREVAPLACTLMGHLAPLVRDGRLQDEP